MQLNLCKSTNPYFHTGHSIYYIFNDRSKHSCLSTHSRRAPNVDDVFFNDRNKHRSPNVMILFFRRSFSIKTITTLVQQSITRDGRCPKRNLQENNCVRSGGPWALCIKGLDAICIVDMECSHTEVIVRVSSPSQNVIMVHFPFHLLKVNIFTH